MGYMIDRIGQRFGRLVVTSLAPPIKTDIAWWCDCDCGTRLNVKANYLTTGRKLSCGCATTWMRKRPNRQSDTEAAKQDLYSSYHFGAKRRGLSFMISRATFDALTESPCHYCGVEPKMRTVLTVNGVDRFDNDKGYESDNVVPCCTDCNVAKLDRTYEDFVAWALRLADFQRAKSCQADTA